MKGACFKGLSNIMRLLPTHLVRALCPVAVVNHVMCIMIFLDVRSSVIRSKEQLGSGLGISTSRCKLVQIFACNLRMRCA